MNTNQNITTSNRTTGRIVKTITIGLTAITMTMTGAMPVLADSTDTEPVTSSELHDVDHDLEAIIDSAFGVLHAIDQMERGDLEAMLAGSEFGAMDGFVDFIDEFADTATSGSTQDVLDFLNRTGFDVSELMAVGFDDGFGETTSVGDIVSGLFESQENTDADDASLVGIDTNPCGVEDPNSVKATTKADTEALEGVGPASGLKTLTVADGEKIGATVITVTTIVLSTIANEAGTPAAGAAVQIAGELVKASYKTILQATYKAVDKVVEATGGYGMKGDQSIDGLGESPVMQELKQALFRDKAHVLSQLDGKTDPTVSNPNPHLDQSGDLSEGGPVGSDPKSGLTNPLGVNGLTVGETPCATFGKLEIAVGEKGLSETEIKYVDGPQSDDFTGDPGKPGGGLT